MRMSDEPHWLSRLTARFHSQVDRAAALVTAAVDPEARDYVLRAAVVLLHAALEDLVRSVRRELLPNASVKTLDEIVIPTPHGPPKPRVGLGTFAASSTG